MSPHQIDTYVGQQIRRKRKAVGLTQTELGNLVGVTFQQVQKYEKGTNRISSSRLYEISKILNTSVDQFFEEINEGFSDEQENFQHNKITDEEKELAIELFCKIDNKILRKNALSILKSISKI